jgi:hypothetical protein
MAEILEAAHPKTIIWDEGDIVFNPGDGEFYVKDLPHAEMHRLTGGEFGSVISQHPVLYCVCTDCAIHLA